MTNEEIEREILSGAEYIFGHQEQGHGKDGWFKPMHVGGRDASPHSRLMAGMVKRGLLERRRWGRAFAYRITPAGISTVRGGGHG